MSAPVVDKVRSHPKYHELCRKRNRFGWTLTIIMLVVYYGYVLLIAFDKEWLAKPIGDGVMTLGIPVGFGVIVFTVLITGFYVRRANTEFDELTRKVIEESRK